MIVSAPPLPPSVTHNGQPEAVNGVGAKGHWGCSVPKKFLNFILSVRSGPHWSQGDEGVVWPRSKSFGPVIPDCCDRRKSFVKRSRSGPPPSHLRSLTLTALRHQWQSSQRPRLGSTPVRPFLTPYARRCCWCWRLAGFHFRFR